MGIFDKARGLTSLTGLSGGTKSSSSNSSVSKNQKFKVERGKQKFFKNVRVGEVRKAVGKTVRVDREDLSAEEVRDDLGTMIGKETLNEGQIRRRLRDKKYKQEDRKDIIGLLRKKYAKKVVEKLKSNKGGAFTIMSKKPEKKPPVKSWQMKRDETSVRTKIDEHSGRVKIGESDISGEKRPSVGESGQGIGSTVNPNQPEKSEFGSQQSKMGTASVGAGESDKSSSIANMGRPAKFDEKEPVNDAPPDIKLAA